MSHKVSRPLLLPQRWKLSFAGIALVAAGVAMFLPDRMGEFLRLPAVAIEFAGTALTLVVLLAIWNAVRCPGCGLKLVRHAMSTTSTREWLRWLFEVEACPRCGLRLPPQE